jgi:hypothetical protein
VKTTISDLGRAEHSGSTLNMALLRIFPDSEKAEIFRKIEPYLTFLNIPQLERQGADMQTRALLKIALRHIVVDASV